MPTISAKISKKELDAITEYANACGETMSNLIRKVMIRHITFMDGFNDYDEYRVGVSVPDNVTSEDETLIVQNAHNKVRRVLGLEEVEL
jgi:hypothetical protein